MDNSVKPQVREDIRSKELGVALAGLRACLAKENDRVAAEKV